eukprot:CAMPEP_0173388380 /NCGR_PEP_ID=MMETSP1356-20130122/10704_1 /TAXON_ID=77927 ORGANISM="Hemiselmis virescens, Strain PCC157" /NCGR_SAMPLE_ID=MMETSP1356 /ASSEMBLY_ACC=CAM_ASM_000847 /LENGTH=43 /DNA_ID= /DNA_START= /DNA_END= /DNA_ORIENTATION=
MATNKNGKTALMMASDAASVDDMEIAEYLQAMGAQSDGLWDMW